MPIFDLWYFCRNDPARLARGLQSWPDDEPEWTAESACSYQRGPLMVSFWPSYIPAPESLRSWRGALRIVIDTGRRYFWSGPKPEDLISWR